MSDLNANYLTAAVGLAGTLFAYRLGLHSQSLKQKHQAQGEVKQRRILFIAFLKAWRIQFDKLHMVSHGYDRDPSAFTDTLPELVHSAELIRGDLLGDRREIFDRTVAELATRGAPDFDNGQRYKNLLDLVDRLVALVAND